MSWGTILYKYRNILHSLLYINLVIDLRACLQSASARVMSDIRWKPDNPVPSKYVLAMVIIVNATIQRVMEIASIAYSTTKDMKFHL